MEHHQQFIELLENHLKRQVQGDIISWEIGESQISGRGIIAKRNIETLEDIFVDVPVIIGPRGTTEILCCAGCCTDTNIKHCSKGCGLPICSIDCENSTQHRKECDLILGLLKQEAKESCTKEISLKIYRALAPLRGLLLQDNDKQLLQHLACHDGDIHGFEVDFLKTKLNLSPSQENFLKTVCQVLDANAFQTVTHIHDKLHCQRGLYALSGLLNHSCVPNATYVFDNCSRMTVRATKNITAGEEIFVSYTTVLWDTQARRHHLWRTKHFYCGCKRCFDPTELNSRLSAIKCLQNGCHGNVLPLCPLDFTSKWKCEDCNTEFSPKRIGKVQIALGSFINSIGGNGISKLMSIVRGNLKNVMPLTNQIAIELKIRLIWMLGHVKGYIWNELNDEDLNLKEELCKEMLEILNKLTLGQCKLRGMLLCELYFCLKEKSKRKFNESSVLSDSEDGRKEIFLEAVKILKGDISAPDEVKNFISFQTYAE